MGDGNDNSVCLRCGKLMPAGASFCNSCGADLSAVSAPGLSGAVSPAEFAASRPAAGAYVPGMGTEPPPAMPAPPQGAQAFPSGPYPPLPAPLAYRYYQSYPQYQPYPYYRPFPLRKTDNLAIVSLVCAVASFMAFPLLPAIAAIATGFVSRERIRKSEGELEGDGLALAGILIGVANVVLFAALLVLIVIAATSQ